MLFIYPVIEKFWSTIFKWFTSYNISFKRIILGDLENNPLFCFVMLSAKKVICNAMKLEKIPQKHQVVNEIRKFLYSERYKAEIKGKRKIFEKKRNTVLCYLKNNK